MCIRDSPQIVVSRTHPGLIKRLFELEVPEIADGIVELKACLLYTSDAADERSSVDLGGRRIIKKKNITTRIEQ